MSTWGVLVAWIRWGEYVRTLGVTFWEGIRGTMWGVFKGDGVRGGTVGGTLGCTFGDNVGRGLGVGMRWRMYGVSEVPWGYVGDVILGKYEVGLYVWKWGMWGYQGVRGGWYVGLGLIGVCGGTLSWGDVEWSEKVRGVNFEEGGSWGWGWVR